MTGSMRAIAPPTAGRAACSTPAGAGFAFGDFIVDSSRRVLLKSGVPKPLRPTAFDVLMCLLERADRVVTREDLFETIWPGRIVESANITQAIYLLRRALGDDHLIVTLPGHGYRFTAPVRRLPEAFPDEAGKPPPPHGEAQSGEPPIAPPKFGSPLGLALPLLGPISEMTALFGRRYEGFYRSTRPYPGRPGYYIHDHLLVRMGSDGLLRVRIATAGVLAEGWILPVQNHLFVICTEFTGGHLLFAIMHAVHSVEVKVLDGITLNNSYDTTRTPTATPVLHHRIANLSGDRAADEAHLAKLSEAHPIEAEDQIPPEIRARLTPNIGPDALSQGGDWVLRAPLATSLSSGRELATP